MAPALAPFAPPSSVIHQIVSEDQAARAALQADLDRWAGKSTGLHQKRRDERALRAQQERLGQIGALK